MHAFLLRLAALPMVFLLAGYPFFPAHFGWHEDMALVTPLTRQIFWVHHAFIILLLILQATLLLGWPRLLTRPSPAGLALAIGLTCFWGLRLIAQLGFYSSDLWWGKPLETVMHILFVLSWTGMTSVFGYTLYTQARQPRPLLA